MKEKIKTLYLTLSEQDLKTAAEILRQGGLVAFPTETVYGLGADALNPKAVSKIFEAKGRPSDNPLIVHIAERAALSSLVREIPAAAEILMEKFWPGPLTLIFPKSDRVPLEVTGGLDTVAVRMPARQETRRLLELTGRPVAAPSANLSGRPSPTAFRHVKEDLDGRVDAILQGDDCEVGVESTVLDLSGPEPVLYRPGGITREEIASVIGPVRLAAAPAPGETPKSPGLKYRHYAPKAPVRILQASLDQARAYAQRLCDWGKTGMLVFDEFPEFDSRLVTRSLGSRTRPEQAAHRLFTALRELDAQGVQVILAPEIPETGHWSAVHNRLWRAAGGTVIRPEPQRILTVCTGNTCRSPMAEALFREFLRKRGSAAQISSAGLYAAGEPASPNALLVMQELGIDLSGHRSRQLVPEIVREADLILTMTPEQAETVSAAVPDAAEKIFALAQWAGETGSVTDPYGGDAERYRACRDAILRLIQKGWDRHYV